MLKNIFRSLFVFGLTLFLTGKVFAVSAVTSVRIEQPKSPTNQNNFNLIFVALDTDNTKTISIVCKKQAPGEAGFTTFATSTTTAGGNTGNCQVNSSIVNTEGTYGFRVEATGSTSASDEVSVNYKTTGPGTPINYSKERNSCTYKIKFRTADDSGKTVEVRLYRSDSTSFDASSANQVDSISIGSNTDGQFENTPPDCSKNYYYGVRAFDSAGNGSGVVGDTVNITTTSTTTTTTGGAAPTGVTGGAIALGQGQGQVLGEGTQEQKGEVKGESTPSGKEEQKKEAVVGKGTGFNIKNLISGGIVLLVLILLYVLFKKSRRTV